MTDVTGDLGRGRRHCENKAWADAFRSLSDADKEAPLGVKDLELLATSAYLIGQDDVYLDTLDRAHGAYVSAGETKCAARCAFWVGLSLLFMEKRAAAPDGWPRRGG